MGAAFSHQAFALTLGEVNTAPNYTVSGYNTVAPGTITDQLFFSLSQDSFVGLTLTNLPQVLPIGGQNITTLNISGLAGDLYKSIGGSWAYQGSFSGSNTIATVNDFSLGSGNWYLGVNGTATGAYGGVYSYAITAVPVPEVGTWAMLLAGLGLVGIQLRRRNRGLVRPLVA